METHKARIVPSEGTVSAQVLRGERESVVCFRDEEELSMAGGIQEKDRKKEGRREGWREGRKKGKDTAEREDLKLVFRSLLFGNEEGRDPDSVHGLFLSQFSGPGHLDSPLGFSFMPHDSSRGHSKVVSGYCHPPPT